jgi:hypothetical protein
MSKPELEIVHPDPQFSNRTGIKTKIKKSRARKAIILLGILLGAGLLSNLSIRAIYSTKVNGSTEWRLSGSQPYLYVYAEDAYSLGYLTGKMLADQILTLKGLFLLLGITYDIQYSQLRTMANEYQTYFPADQIEEMHGMAAGASAGSGFIITFSDILIQNTWYDVFYGRIAPTLPGPLGCTAILGWSNITSTDSNLHVIGGQNFDLQKPFGSTLAFVLHQLRGLPAIFGLRVGGCLNLPIGKNFFNVSTYVTLVQTNLVGDVGIPVCSRARTALSQASTADGFLSYFYGETGSVTACGFNLLVNDPFQAFAVASVPGISINETLLLSSYLLRTNTFLTDSWQQWLMDPNYSKDRQTRAEFLVEEAVVDNIIEHSELLSILQDKPVICRSTTKFTETATLAFITTSQFGLGNPSDNFGGPIPL